MNQIRLRRRVILILACLAVPGFIFLNAWQGYRYNELTSQVAALEQQQQDLLNANRDVIAQIAYESSPERVEQKALALGLRPAPTGVTRLQVPPSTVAPQAEPSRGGTGQ
jgi:cell division protein FtsL